ncbi:right-handed parallel beta-helix repeat-containing protein [Glycomyces sp. L485]|uniref:right-handed parallel beta-helix repeat-containing protein n=1 Tax=Glycomyces sp. L485 TaxID=2909235 RepID=UPI001F4A3B17|nr:right-handed parallel beta-helix repeat-containing protein [Glycomyces sp. L485]MCH7232776.1 right-handed parallel beta-helix repeat-containing protein [Glycomyces sp. L485]
MPPHGPKALLPVTLSALAVGAALLAASPAAAAETEPPDYRDEGPHLLVCPGDADAFAERNADVSYNRRIDNEQLYEACAENGHRDLADAVAAATEPGMRILILPGQYTASTPVVIDGRADLQIEGRGDSPEDVTLTGGYTAETVIEASDATGLYLRGFTVTGGSATGLLLSGAQGATVEQVNATDNGKNGIHINDSTAVDLVDCTATGNDAAGIALHDTEATVTGCDSGDNLTGLLDTGAGRLTLEANRLHDNTTGLVVTDTAEGHRLDAHRNSIYDNNADHYGNLTSGACDTEPAADTICPAETTPTGVGILIDEGNDTRFIGNHLWGHRTAAAMLWGETGIDDTASHRNRFEGNTLGYRDDGHRSRNRLDLWWDGQGEGNCFTEPGALHTTPAVLPVCDADNGPARLLGEPVKTFKIWHCDTGPLQGDTVPAGCDWFGAKFTDRLEFQAAVVFAASLLFLTGAGWLGAARSPNPPPPMSMTFSAIATGSAALLLVLASWSGRSDYEALAIGLWGAGWILAGRSWFSTGLHAFGGFTALIGGLAVLDALDRGTWIIPVVPVSPAWMWLALLPLWTLLALGAVLRRHRREPASPPVQRTPVTVPAHDRFDW